ncbi:MAG: hypothetical protein EXR73_02070 [Myxococcales bacterium]|nr:hypothetical protein [Myxococcales bacterium]
MRARLRRLAGLILLLVLIFVGGRLLLGSDRPVSVTIVYRLAEGTPADELEATLRPEAGGEPAAHFRSRRIASEVVQTTRLRPGVYRVELVVRGPLGAAHASRRLAVEAGTRKIVVELAGLTPRPR